MGDNLGSLALPTLSSPTMSVESVVATAIAGALGLHLLLALLLIALQPSSPIDVMSRRASCAAPGASYNGTSAETIHNIGDEQNANAAVVRTTDRVHNNGRLHHASGVRHKDNARTIEGAQPPDDSGNGAKNKIAGQRVLPDDVLTEVVRHCDEETVMNIALTSWALWNLTRGRRWRSLVIKPRRFFAFAIYLYLRAVENKSCEYDWSCTPAIQTLLIPSQPIGSFTLPSRASASRCRFQVTRSISPATEFDTRNRGHP